MSAEASRAGRGRAFAPADALASGATITLDAAESHYLVRVRRVGVGDAVEIMDGVRAKYDAAVVRADAKACVVTLRSVRPSAATAPWIVLVGIVEPRAMAEVLSGASEAGAQRLVAVHTRRAQSNLPSRARIDKVLRAAQRQCGRAVPLLVGGPMDLVDALRLQPSLPGFVADPATPAAPPPATDGGRILIGPEGGLTAAEIQQALDADFARIGLGPYLQRTPTAVVSALARVRIW